VHGLGVKLGETWGEGASYPDPAARVKLGYNVGYHAQCVCTPKKNNNNTPTGELFNGAKYYLFIFFLPT
jgi:hypothetical protein